jgi:hypothetical protein
MHRTHCASGSSGSASGIFPPEPPGPGEADFEAITRYFQPPAEDEGFDVIGHER